jgi:hypothetical protein
MTVGSPALRLIKSAQAQPAGLRMAAQLAGERLEFIAPAANLGILPPAFRVIRWPSAPDRLCELEQHVGRRAGAFL